MIILVISIIALGIIAALIAKLSKHDGEEKITVVETCATCNGTNDKCEQDCQPRGCSCLRSALPLARARTAPTKQKAPIARLVHFLLGWCT